MLKIDDLHVAVGNQNGDGNEILKGLSLEVPKGEVHAVMGPNGSGKSTLAGVLSGRPGFEATRGKITFLGKDLLDMEPNQRAGEGLFQGLQYPVEIPGVSNINFLRTALNAQHKYRGEDEVDAAAFLKRLKEEAQYLDMDFALQKRPVNVGFSGGEKKRNEMLQMLILQPRLAVLDETDSGLDIDALRIVANGINRIRAKDRALLLITHYQRLLKYVEPDFVHVLSQGRIVKTGDKALALELEEKGYAAVA